VIAAFRPRAIQIQRSGNIQAPIERVFALIIHNGHLWAPQDLEGQTDGKSQAKGVGIPLADLLIGVTAIELGYSVGTGNLRHFQRIPGLSVMRF